MSEPRAPLPYAWPDVKSRLQGQILQLLSALGISEREIGGKVSPRNPTRTDRHPGSFVIWTSHGRDGAVGAWKDYATGEAGDVFDLIAYLAGLREKIDAYWWALDFLHLGRGVVRTAAQDVAARERAARERAAADAQMAKREAAWSAKLFTAWLALPKWPGTPVETYLRQARGIDLSRLPGLSLGALRFEAACEYVDEETGVITEHPAMVAAVNRGPGVVALHRTYLAPGGLGKADLNPAKKMLGPMRGGAMRLTAGASGLSAEKAAEAGKLDPLLIGEGIETTLTVACAQPDYRAWAAGSLSLMGLIEWPACASAVVLLKDPMSNPTTLAAFAKVEAHWRAQAKGRPVKVAEPWAGSDFNDLVKGAA